MEYLIDTHTLLWFFEGNSKISVKAKLTISNPDATKFVSMATLWEIAIKLNLGKLKLEVPFIELKRRIIDNGFEFLPITFDHILTLTTLDLHHRDPFDRIIISQALSDKLTVISKDENFPKYDINLLWK